MKPLHICQQRKTSQKDSGTVMERKDASDFTEKSAVQY